MTPISDAAKNALIDAFNTAINAGAGAGYMTICEGATVLITHTFSDPAAGTASAGSATVNAIATANPVATGTADNAKFYDSNAVYHFSGTVAISGSPDVLMESLSVTVGTPIGISTGVVIYG